MPLGSWWRRLASDAVHSGWDWAVSTGSIGPTSPRASRFHSLGAGSCIGFPPGPWLATELVGIGAGTLVCPHVTLSVGMPGENLVGSDPVISIGARCTIGRGSALVGRCGIVIEDDVTTAPNVYITDHNHSYAEPEIPIARQWVSEAAVRIGAGSWLGTGVVVLPGTDIGRNVTVAAGSVVRGAIPDQCVIAGAPARVVRRYHPETGWEPPLRGGRIPLPEEF
jgi:acetyltransferase-like isoleucine patch superfamily enzyme